MRFESKAEEEGFALVEMRSSGEEEVWIDDMTIGQVEATIAEEYHYDPFGMNLVGIEKAGDNRFQYNQQSEKQQDATGNGYFYETPLRQYDPQLGRFGGVDLLAEEYATMSPYQYGANNPILFSDPTGARLDNDCYECYTSGGFGLDARMFGRVSINTVGGSYSVGGNTYGGGGYTSGYGTGNDRINAMYGQAKAEQWVEQTFGFTPQAGVNYSIGANYSKYGVAYQVYIDRNQQHVYAMGNDSYWEDLEDKFAKGFKNANLSDEASASGILGGLGLVNEATAAYAKRQAALYASKYSKEAIAAVSNNISLAGKSLGYFGLLATGYEAAVDRKITLGDGYKAIISGASIAFPVFGVVYGVVDLGFHFTTGTNLTDRIANGIDNTVNVSVEF